MKFAMMLLGSILFSGLAQASDVQLDVLIKDSKVVFTSYLGEFGLKVKGTQLPCRDRYFYMHSAASLYDGWDPANSLTYRETTSNKDFRSHTIASCRDASTEALAWFTKDRGEAYTISEHLLYKGETLSSLPLTIQVRSLENGSLSYYSCQGPFTKTKLKESDEAITYRLTADCEATGQPTAGERGPIDFVSAPGAFAAVVSYKPWMLPSVQSNQATFDKTVKGLLQFVQEGSYTGVMSTLKKACKVDIAVKGDTLVIDHTILGAKPRTRHLELKASQLIGAVDGDVFADPIRIADKSVGQFAAAEFQTEDQKSVVVRFEGTTGLDGQIVRINGSEAYCRRLQKQ